MLTLSSKSSHTNIFCNHSYVTHDNNMINEDLSGSNSRANSSQNLPLKRSKHASDSSDDDDVIGGIGSSPIELINKGKESETFSTLQPKSIIYKRPHLIKTSEQGDDNSISNLMHKGQPQFLGSMQNQPQQYYLSPKSRTTIPGYSSKLLHDERLPSFQVARQLSSSTSPPTSYNISKQPLSEAEQDLDDNLVKSVNDLPKFVTIEGFRVAAYSSTGESFLCLPQLLQYLRQKFDLQRIIEGFESPAITFPFATPKQVNGLVKACVLSSNYKSCSLIRRSDAERVSLKLFEEKFARKAPADLQKQLRRLDDLTSGDANKEYHQTLTKPSYDGAQRIGNISEHKTQDVNEAQDLCYPSSNDPFDLARPSTSNLELYNTKNIEKKETFSGNSLKTLSPNQQRTSYHRGAYGHSVDRLLAMAANFRLGKIDEILFNNEAQRPMLLLARAATSSLTIRIYHRCFGKCMGLYYPALLFDSDSECIECTYCHMMFSPRHFVGHSHGCKENDVVHWGFNSYNWRNYIRLSRKQTLNKLDDDELLLQFRLLRSSPNGPDEPSMNVDSTIDSLENMSTIELTQNKSEVETHKQISSSLLNVAKAEKKLSSDMTKLPSSSIPSSSSYNLNYMSIVGGSCSRPSSLKDDNLSIYHSRRSPQTERLQQKLYSVFTKDNIDIEFPKADSGGRQSCYSSPSSKSRDNFCCDIISPSTSSTIGTHAPFVSQIQCESLLPASQNFDRETLSSRNLPEFPFYGNLQPAALAVAHSPSSLPGSDGAHRSHHHQPFMIHRNISSNELEQDRYICCQLTSYLNEKGLSFNLISDIVTKTLKIMRESRSIV